MSQIKKAGTLVVFILLVVSLTSCSSEEESSAFKVWLNDSSDPQIVSTETDGASLIVDPSTVTQSDLVCTLRNDSDSLLHCGSEFYIAQREDSGKNEWVEIPFLEYGEHEGFCWDLVLYTVDGKDAKELNIAWSKLYGTLDPGEYLLIKEVSRSDETANLCGALFSIKG